MGGARAPDQVIVEFARAWGRIDLDAVVGMLMPMFAITICRSTRSTAVTTSRPTYAQLAR